MTAELLGSALALSLIGGGSTIAYYKIDNLTLEKSIIIEQGKVRDLERDKQDLHNSIEEQNNAIDSIKIDAEKKMSEYMKNAPKIAEKVLSKYIKDINITRGNCSDANELNRMLDGISLIDF